MRDTCYLTARCRPSSMLRPTASPASCLGALTSVRRPRPGLALHPARRPPAAAARAPDRARRHRRPVARWSGRSAAPTPCACSPPRTPPANALSAELDPRAPRRLRRAARRAVGGSPAAPAPRRSATSAAMSCIRSAPTACAPTPISRGEAVFGDFALVTPARGRTAGRRRPRVARPQAISSSSGVSRRHMSARSSSTSTCSTARWTGTGVRRRSMASASATTPILSPSRGSTSGPSPAALRPGAHHGRRDGRHGGAGPPLLLRPPARPAAFDRKFSVGLWETAVLAGTDREFDARYRNPLTLLLLGQPVRARRGRQRHVRARRAAGGSAADHARGAARPRRPAVREYLRRGPLSQPLGAHARGLGPARRAATLAGLLHPGLEPRLSHARPVRELHRRSGVGLGRNFDDKDQLTRHRSACRAAPGGSSRPS